MGESGRGLRGLRSRETGTGILDGLGSLRLISSPGGIVGESGRGLSGLRSRETDIGVLDGLDSLGFMFSPGGMVGESGRGLSGLRSRETNKGIREGFALSLVELGMSIGALVAGPVRDILDMAS